VRILHVGRDDPEGFFYYVMEAADDCLRQQEIIPEHYCPRSLTNDLTRRGRLSLTECVKLGLALTASLEALHQRDLVHRDIKPSNIIYVNGEPKLADIGLVARIGDATSSNRGTLGYMPPEGSGKAAADVFSLGKLLYVAWTKMDARDDFPILPPDLDEGDLSTGIPQFNDIILKACEPEAARRFKSAQEMHDALERLLANGQKPARPSPGRDSTVPMRTTVPVRSYVSILGHSAGKTNLRLANLLEAELKRKGWSVVVDKHASVNVEWATQFESKTPQAEAVVALLSAESVQSEMMSYELELAREAGIRRGKPIIIPVRIGYAEAIPAPLSLFINSGRCLEWKTSEDDSALVAKIVEALNSPAEWPKWRLADPRSRFEPPGGAMPLCSAFYVIRPVDHEFRAAIGRGDSIVLLRGARQMGKSSLLARGLDEARTQGVLVVVTDFQALSGSDFESLNCFYKALANSMAEQLDLEIAVADRWDSSRGPNANFDRFIRREVFDKLDAQIVWGLDEVDRLFACSFGSEVFGMFRSWHNKRALAPQGPWTNLTLAIAYATEAHLFISDLNQSPFNVGTPLSLEDFQREQVADLNCRYGSPLQDEAQLDLFFRLLNGHPFLVRRGLHELATRHLPFEQFAARAARDEGIFGDHLRRMLVSLAKDPTLLEVVRGAVLRNRPVDPESFYRLRAAGVMAGETAPEARLRCHLYAEFLKRHL
jgi:hypothetical protein